MSDLPGSDTLCERCSLLSFDDAAIGGYEVVGKDGVARLFFPESKLEVRPPYWQQNREIYGDLPDYRLVRLKWKLRDVLPDMPRLSRSSQRGCTFCEALRRSLDEVFARDAKLNPMSAGTLNLVAFLSLDNEGIEAIVIEATFNQTSVVRVIQIIFPVEAHSNCAEWLRVQPTRNASYLDPINIRNSRQLLDHCTSKCHPETPTSFMPTRLIDVGHDASDVLRLVLSSNISKSEQTKYAALSYCWGSEKDAESQFKTEKGSLEDRCVGLPSELITPTTNDAIALTRAIGLRYLWIDALCIVQDDKDDWLHESSQMHLVYRHAFVTFCSLNSNSCHERFLNRAPTIEIPLQSTIRKDINGSYLIRLRPRWGLYIDRTKYPWDLALSKWGKRCWTYQEQEMSTRCLLFGSLRMHFACARCQWSEGDEAPRDRPRRSTSGSLSDVISRFKDKWFLSRELYAYWDELICNYGHRSVTLDKDRLPAIAGLARMIGEALHDRYVAGLWQGDLLRGLTWYIRDDHSSSAMLSRGLEAHVRNIRQRNYVAPSWSWATCPAVTSMGFSGTRLVEESTVIDVNVETNSGDSYGQVFGGFLRIRGKIARMSKSLPDDEETQSVGSWSGIEPNYESVHLFTDWLHDDEEVRLESLVLMLLYRIELRDATSAPSLQALLLHRADENDQYYRVGVIKSEGHEGYTEVIGWFKDSQEETICII